MEIQKIYFYTGNGFNKKSHEDKSIKSCKQLIKKYYDLDSPETFYIVNNQIQCAYGKARSFQDLVSICKSRFPRTSLHTISKSLIRLCMEDKLKCLYCTDIHKITFHTFERWYSFIVNKKLNSFVNDYLLRYTVKGNPSFNQILEYSGIKLQ